MSYVVLTVAPPHAPEKEEVVAFLMLYDPHVPPTEELIVEAELQLSFEGWAKEIKGIVAKNSNKILSRTEFRCDFGFIAIRIV